MAFPYVTFTITGSMFSVIFFFLFFSFFKWDGACLPACGKTHLLLPAKAGGVLPPAMSLFVMSSVVTNRPPAFLCKRAESRLALLQKSALIQHISAAARSIPLQRRQLLSAWQTLPLLFTLMSHQSQNLGAWAGLSMLKRCDIKNSGWQLHLSGIMNFFTCA